MITPEQLAKLPKWAQDEFNKLERERFCAVRELKEWRDDQTESPVSIHKFVSDGEQQGPGSYTRYVQTRQLEVKWHGVELRISLHDDGPQHDNSIGLSWNGERALGGTQIAFVPTSFQQASLIAKENMR